MPTPHDISFQDAIELYRAVYRRFDKIEGRPWGAEGIIVELVKQVGELDDPLVALPARPV